ncbi:MAG: hypothetical protein AMXMBFR33_39540 [Candidatus Xenobia bacterium]
MRKNRGIVLITAVVLSVVLVMFVGAAIALGPGNLMAGQAVLHQGHAQRAAESGLNYALTRLRADPLWRGDKNAVTINLPDLWVQEDNGNVVGLVRTQDGTWSQFRLRFNYQDGPVAGGADGLDDPATLFIDHKYVSVNNLQGIAAAPVPRADGAGYAVTAASARPFQTPVMSVSLAAEGKAGPACQQLSPANPNPPLTGSNSATVVEAIYQVPNLQPTVQESGSMSAGNFAVTLRTGSPGKVTVTSKDTTKTPRIRSKGTAGVSGGNASENLLANNGEVRSVDSALTAGTLYDSAQVSVAGEAAVDPFYQLAWADVKKADPAGPKLAAGTYVWWQDGSLHYYDMSYTDYVNFIQVPANANNPGVSPPPLPPEVTVDPANHKMKLTGSLYINPTATTNELSIIPRGGAPEAPPGDPEAGGGSMADSAAVTLTSDISQGGILHQFLLQYQGPSGEIDAEDAGGAGADKIEIIWDATNIQINSTNGASDQDAIKYIFDQTTQPTWGWDTGCAPIPFDQVAAAAQFGFSGGGPPAGEIDPPGVTDSLTAADLSLEFDPPVGGAVVLTSEGDVRLTGSVEGVGGSITSNGDIRIVGMGATFSSEAVNMYAAGDIYFSTLDETVPGNYAYQPVSLKGVVYAQGNFTARLGSETLPGQWANFDLEGTLVAYGGDPTGPPGTNGKGKIDLRAEAVDLILDTSYVGALSSILPPGFEVKTIAWSTHR